MLNVDDDDDFQRDEQLFVWQLGARESIVQQALGHQPFHCQSLLFVSDFPKPPFVLVCLVDEVPGCFVLDLVLKCASVQSTASVERSTLSTPSTLTRIRSP